MPMTLASAYGLLCLTAAQAQERRDEFYYASEMNAAFTQLKVLP